MNASRFSSVQSLLWPLMSLPVLGTNTSVPHFHHQVHAPLAHLRSSPCASEHARPPLVPKPACHKADAEAATIDDTATDSAAVRLRPSFFPADALWAAGLLRRDGQRLPHRSPCARALRPQGLYTQPFHHRCGAAGIHSLPQLSPPPPPKRRPTFSRRALPPPLRLSRLP